MDRQRISSGRPNEEQTGYSRAVRVGNHVFVAGSTALNALGQVDHPGDMYGQTVAAIRTIASALSQAGATLEDVVRTRIFVTDMRRRAEVSRAHREFFGAIRPASTLVEVSALAHPDMLVEVEADAIISGSS
jgi:enamine deaminase RidA (YjgF/YER057c/UK114 family)